MTFEEANVQTPRRLFCIPPLEVTDFPEEAENKQVTRLLLTPFPWRDTAGQPLTPYYMRRPLFLEDRMLSKACERPHPQLLAFSLLLTLTLAAFLPFSLLPSLSFLIDTVLVLDSNESLGPPGRKASA